MTPPFKDRLGPPEVERDAPQQSGADRATWSLRPDAAAFNWDEILKRWLELQH
jgi:hypothetical protein